MGDPWISPLIFSHSPTRSPGVVPSRGFYTLFYVVTNDGDFLVRFYTAFTVTGCVHDPPVFGFDSWLIGHFRETMSPDIVSGRTFVV